MFSVSVVDDVTISLVGLIGNETANEANALLKEHVRNRANSNLVIDLVELQSVSSVVLSLLLCGLRAAKEVRCNLSYKNMPQDLYNMARVSGIESILLKTEA